MIAKNYSIEAVPAAWRIAEKHSILVLALAQALTRAVLYEHSLVAQQLTGRTSVGIVARGVAARVERERAMTAGKHPSHAASGFVGAAVVVGEMNSIEVVPVETEVAAEKKHSIVVAVAVAVAEALPRGCYTWSMWLQTVMQSNSYQKWLKYIDKTIIPY